MKGNTSGRTDGRTYATMRVMPDQPVSITMPNDFPTADLSAFMLRIDVLDAQFRSMNKGEPSTPWREFAAGAEGLRVRFRSLAEADEAFRTILPRGAETHEDRYEEERSLFVFFTSLVSTFECTCYMLHAVGAQLSPTTFPLVTEDHKVNVTPRQTEKRFCATYAGEPLTAELTNLINNPKFGEAIDIRNILSHRGSVHRDYKANIVLGGPPIIIGGPNSTVIPTMKGLPVDANLTADRRAWIASWLRSTMMQALVFADNHVK